MEQLHVGQVLHFRHGLAANNLVNPLVGNLEVAQLVGERVTVGALEEIRGGALNNGHVRTPVGDGWHQGSHGGPRADHDHLLVP